MKLQDSYVGLFFIGVVGVSVGCLLLFWLPQLTSDLAVIVQPNKFSSFLASNAKVIGIVGAVIGLSLCMSIRPLLIEDERKRLMVIVGIVAAIVVTGMMYMETEASVESIQSLRGCEKAEASSYVSRSGVITKMALYNFESFCAYSDKVDAQRHLLKTEINKD